MESWNQCFAQLADLETFVQLSSIGLHHGVTAQEWVDTRRDVARVLEEPDPFQGAGAYEAARREAGRLSAFSVGRGPAYLLGTATVTLWTILEASVDELAVGLLDSPTKWNTPDTLEKLEGPLLPFLGLPDSERAEFLVEELKQSVKARLRPGLARFEALLEPLGLGGGVDPEVRRTLLELSQVRNVLVHRRGRIDRRFVQACPWSRRSVGDNLDVTQREYEAYSLAVRAYALEINERLYRRAGDTPTPFSVATRQEITARLQSIQRSTGDHVGTS